MFRKGLPKNSNKRTLLDFKENKDLTTKLSKKSCNKRSKKQAAVRDTKKKKGQWTERGINSIMTKNRIHFIGRKYDSGNRLDKSKKKRTKNVFWASFVSSVDTLSIPIVTRNMSKHFDTWKQCLPRANEGRLTQMVDGKSFPLWNYRSGIITRALSKKVDIGPTNTLFAKLTAPTTQKETRLLKQTSNDTKKIEQMQFNFSNKFVKRDPVRENIRPLVTRTRKLHLRNKVLSYIYQDAKVWWGCEDANSQNSTAGASENKPKNAGNDAGLLYQQPEVQILQHNESNSISFNSRLPRETTLNNHLHALDTLTIPIVTRSISRLFETWQQSFPRSRQDLQTQLVNGALWYHQSGIIGRTLTECSGMKTSPTTGDLPTAFHPHYAQCESLSDAKEKVVIPQQMKGLSRVRVGIRRSDDRSMITRSRKLHLKNKVVSHIYQDAKNWWGRGDSNSVHSASKAFDSKQRSESLERMAS